MASALFTQSAYSFNGSLLKAQDIPVLAKQRGYRGVALVDHHSLAGTPAFLKACQENEIKGIIGLSFDLIIENQEYQPFLLAGNDQGFLNLMHLANYLNKYQKLNLKDLNKYLANNFLFFFSDDMPACNLNGELKEAEIALIKQRELLPTHIIAFKPLNSLREYQLKLRDCCRKLKQHCCLVPQFTYEAQDDYRASLSLKAILKRKQLNELSVNKGYFMPYEEVSNYFSNDVGLWQFSDYLIDKCHLKFEFKTQLPIFEAGKDSKELLKQKALAGLKKKNLVNDIYLNRLKKELQLIFAKGFADYFLIVADYIAYAKENNILVGPGRGSAVGSLLAYALDISVIDPVKNGLFFERFLNTQRQKMPDIDTDFEAARREEVIAYVQAKYGRENVAKIATFDNFGIKQLLNDLGKLLNKEKQCQKLLELIPYERRNDNLKALYETDLKFKERIDLNDDYLEIYNLAIKLQGLPRQRGVHASGVIISRAKLADICPLIEDNGQLISAYTMQYLEDLGLIKMDFLALNNLDIISDCLKEIPNLKLEEIPLDDRKTYELLGRGDTSLLFQLGSVGMKETLMQLKPQSLNDIALCIAAYRPGTKDNIKQIALNRRNINNIKYLHPDLEPILRDTYGLIIYQEQILLIAAKMAGYSYEKGDILREALAKKKKEKIQALKSDFIGSCISRGYRDYEAEQVYLLIERFAQFGFNKSHAYAYGLLAYWMAYLKANHTLAFFKANLKQNNNLATLRELRNLGYNILPVDIRYSQSTYRIINKNLILPFNALKGISSVQSDKLCVIRDVFFKENKLEDSALQFFNLLKRLFDEGITFNELNILVNGGAFNIYQKYFYNGTSFKNAEKLIIYYLNNLAANNPQLIPNIKECEANPYLEEELAYGFNFFNDYLFELKDKYHLEIQHFDEFKADTYIKGIGRIEHVKTIVDRNGKEMAFITLTEQQASLNITLFSETFAILKAELKEGSYLYFEGRLGYDKKGQETCRLNKGRILR